MTQDQSEQKMYEPWQGDPGSVERKCPKCGGNRLWRDLDVGQETCLDCDHYNEFEEQSDERTDTQVRFRDACPTCGRSAWLRQNKSPDYRCEHGHEFNELAEGADRVD